jgi:hypothetical protein
MSFTTDVLNQTRAGTGDLGKGRIDDPKAEHKRSDFCDLRDFDLDRPDVLSDLSRCCKYCIALTDCDGFRIDIFMVPVNRTAEGRTLVQIRAVQRAELLVLANHP